MVLGKAIGGKGEGTAYKSNIGKICKIYHSDKVTNFRATKLGHMQLNKIVYNGLCWPEELLYLEDKYSSKKYFVGYLMNEGYGYTLESAIHFMGISEKIPNWTRLELVELCLSILGVIKELHKCNVILGDINGGNILVRNYNDVYFIDCDSFQIGQYPCPVGTDEFTPKELIGKQFKYTLRSKDQDMFAVTVLMFKILFLWQHPYSYKGGTSIVDNIKKSFFPYRFEGENGNYVPDGIWRFIWSNTTYYIKQMFSDCFAKNKRLTIEELYDVFKRYKHDIKKVMLQMI
ncbi:protein kinase domain-containing protein [Brachyspira alvinipulli]|uniref:protein kinase domain-containing protein n=1 Tax=Brachyspira alvinipulli TaxID=84379 RepID=UPI000481646F|nr:hypothetical protein [Brachyspira alvinipulli]